MKNISIIGTGYVGLITGAGLAKLGNKVICIDVSKEKVDKVNSKDPPIYEKGLKQLLEQIIPEKLTATLDLKKAIQDTDVTFVCVGTPSKKQGEIDLTFVFDACKQVGEAIKDKDNYHVIVIKSTVIAGTTEEAIKIIEQSSGKKFGEGFGMAMSPEFLKEGSALDDFFNPDRVVIGSTDSKSREIVADLYKDLTCPIIETPFKEAEMIKYASNAMLATRISFINEVGNVCKKLSIDTNIVAKGMGLDKRIGPQFLRSGIGFGGSCFPKDVAAVMCQATKLGVFPRLLKSVLDVNKEQPSRFLELVEHIGIAGKKIALLGLTFKADTDDVRESPSIAIIKELLTEKAELFIYDPKGIPVVKEMFPHLNFTETGQEAIDKAEIILILTEWPEFSTLSYGDKLVLDSKNIFDGNRPKNYQGICW